MNSSERTFLEATAISPNIGRVNSYIPHCFKVSEKCARAGERISKNYRFLESLLNPSQLAFMGLIEDSFYLIGGNGKNNPNRQDSNPFHEILTYVQFDYIGVEYKELAEGMALHFTAPEILKQQQDEGRFKEVPNPLYHPNHNLVLEILTVIDALCTTEYLPDRKGSIQNALSYRIEDLRTRRREDPNHPLIKSLNAGGEERLRKLVEVFEALEKREFSEKEVRERYGLL